MNKDVFVFAIAYNCGLIVKKCLESYHKYHDTPIHIFGTKNDLDLIDKHDNNVYIDITDDTVIRDAYTRGHLGTAYIWANVINKHYGDYSKVIQIDSDVLFLNECLNDITNLFNEGYDLIGTRRSYKTIAGLQDVVGTFFVGVNIDKITKRDYNTIVQMSAGYHNPAGHHIIDFFDPISFDILYNGGRIYHLNYEEYGSCDENGNFDNGYLGMNTLYDYGTKIVHFAGIGSGMNFYNNGDGNVPHTYTSWAKSRYALYVKLFYNEDINIPFNNDDYLLSINYLPKDFIFNKN